MSDAPSGAESAAAPVPEGEVAPAADGVPDLKRPLEEATGGATAPPGGDSTEAPPKRTRVSRFSAAEPADLPPAYPIAAAAAAAAEAAVRAAQEKAVDPEKVDSLLALAKGTRDTAGKSTEVMIVPATKVAP